MLRHKLLIVFGLGLKAELQDVKSVILLAGCFQMRTLPFHFVGVCIEFVAAITWIAEVFADKAQKEKWLGITQLFASLGGVSVAGVNLLILGAKGLPNLAATIWFG